MRQGTPGSSPGRYTPVQSPSKLNQSYTVKDDEAPSKTDEPVAQPKFNREIPPSPTKGANSPGNPSQMMRVRTSGTATAANGTATNFAAVQMREIREAFQVLDRDNDGTINKDDVADVLVNLGG